MEKLLRNRSTVKKLLRMKAKSLSKRQGRLLNKWMKQKMCRSEVKKLRLLMKSLMATKQLQGLKLLLMKKEKLSKKGNKLKLQKMLQGMFTGMRQISLRGVMELLTSRKQKNTMRTVNLSKLRLMRSTNSRIKMEMMKKF